MSDCWETLQRTPCRSGGERGGRKTQVVLNGRKSKGEIGPLSHIFADFCRLSTDSGNQRAQESQIYTENCSKPQIFGRNPQIVADVCRNLFLLFGLSPFWRSPLKPDEGSPSQKGAPFIWYDFAPRRLVKTHAMSQTKTTTLSIFSGYFVALQGKNNLRNVCFMLALNGLFFGGGSKNNLATKK